MSHRMYTGPVGSGKTFCAVADALEDPGSFIVANMPFDMEAARDFWNAKPRILASMIARADGTERLEAKQLVQWKDFADPECFKARCGALVIDEAHLWLDARKYDSLTPEARMKIVEHRKDDITIISTTQDVSFIDKVYRILCDEIRVVRMMRLPFIGWIWKTSVRPTIVCRDCGRIRRDGFGDDRGISKWFGFGTLYVWDTFKAKDLLDAQDNTGEDVPGFVLRNRRGREYVEPETVAIHAEQLGIANILAAYGSLSAEKFKGLWETALSGVPFPTDEIKSGPSSQFVASQPKPKTKPSKS